MTAMMQLLERLCPLERSLVSDGYDKAIEIIGEVAPIEVAEFPSGQPCWTWTVPEKWTCHEAYLEAIDGRRLIDTSHSPLHCVDYSLPFDSVVTREELLAHLHVHPSNPDAIPYVFKFYERDWGLCCTRRLRDALTDPEYRVVIRSEFSDGTLKVGQWWLPGASDRVFILMAHLCHPCQANDDLTGVVVGLEVMDRLASVPNREHTFLLLLVPETIGTVAWLSSNEHLVPDITGGLFLEMLGCEQPHGLQRSYAGSSQIDLCCEQILAEGDPDAYVRDFRGIVMNDELEFNAPSFRIPFLSLSRCLPPEADGAPYPEYHTHLDSPDIVSEASLVDSADMAYRMALAVDDNCFPRAKFKGQVFCSRYGLYPRDPAEHDAFFRVMFELDGTNSLVDICRKHDLPFESVRRIVTELAKHDLVERTVTTRKGRRAGS